MSRATAAVLVAAALAGCGAMPGSGSGKFEPEVFGSTDLHARNFDTSPSQTCEAARRALLSQGFTINTASGDRVVGRKNFQPRVETHVEIEVGVVCAPEGRSGRTTVAFVSATQDQYALKKSNNSASVGVPVLGSLSLPIISSDDSMVKVASETIASAPFYTRFYKLLDRYLAVALEIDESDAESLAPVPSAAAGPVPKPAPTTSPSPVVIPPRVTESVPAAAASASASAPPAEAASAAHGPAPAASVPN